MLVHGRHEGRQADGGWGRGRPGRRQPARGRAGVVGRPDINGNDGRRKKKGEKGGKKKKLIPLTCGPTCEMPIWVSTFR